ncbi:hypothetical protein AAY473_014417 [Plecturocebus cupreus]
MAHACNPSTLEGQGRWIAGTQEFRTSLDDMGLALSPRPDCSGTIIAHRSHNFLGSSDPLILAFRVAGITGAFHHTWLLFLFSVGTGFHHVGQAGFELLRSSGPSALAPQSAAITGMSQCSEADNLKQKGPTQIPTGTRQMAFFSAAQAGVQCCELSSRHGPPTRFKRSSCVSLLSS